MSSPEELRLTIARATVPLIGEYETLTTARIAQAAGVAEADLLAVFPDKEAVLQACVSMFAAHLSAVLDPAAEVRELDAIRLDQPVAARLARVIDILAAYHDRVRAELVSLEHAGFTSRTDYRPFGSLPEMEQAVARLLRPDESRLRLPAEALAEVFLGLTRYCTRLPNELQPLPAGQVIDLFLHGALTTPD